MSLSQSRCSTVRLARLVCLSLAALAIAAAIAPAALAADIDPPTLVSSEPAGGAALAAPPASIVLHYSEPLASSPVPTATLVGGGGPATVEVLDSDVTVTPQGVFYPHSSVTLTVDGVTDAAGNPAAPAVVSFTVDRVPAIVRLTLSRPGIIAGKTAELRCTIAAPHPLAPVAGLPVAGLPVVVERRLAGEAGFTALVPGTTNTAGFFRRGLSPTAIATFRGTTPETTDLLATSAEVTLNVRPRLEFETPATVFKGRKIIVRGKVFPAHPGGTVTIQRKVEGKWKSVRDVKLNSRSRFSSRWVASRVGTYRFRLMMAADEQHLSRVTSDRVVKVAPPNPHNISPTFAHFIVVDLSECHLYYYEHGVVIRKFDCVVGKPSTPTPIGQWPVYQKVVGMWGPYGPFTMWYHSPYHFGIHGTNEPWLLKRFPRYFSHGCTRLANTNISWLFPKVPVGTPVRNIP